MPSRVGVSIKTILHRLEAKDFPSLQVLMLKNNIEKNSMIEYKIQEINANIYAYYYWEVSTDYLKKEFKK